MCSLLCPAYHVWLIMCSLLCPAYHVRLIMCSLLCPAYHVQLIMCSLLCPAYYVRLIMCSLLCPAYHVRLIMCILLCPAYHVWFIMCSHSDTKCMRHIPCVWRNAGMIHCVREQMNPIRKPSGCPCSLFTKKQSHHPVWLWTDQPLMETKQMPLAPCSWRSCKVLCHAVRATTCPSSTAGTSSWTSKSGLQSSISSSIQWPSSFIILKSMSLLSFVAYHV